MSFENAQFNNKLLRTPGPVLGCQKSTVTSEEVESQAYWDRLLETCQPINDFLELKSFTGELISKPSMMHGNISEGLNIIEDGHGSIDDLLNQYLVPSSLVQRWGSAMGILCLSL